ncbi:hypothetical protein IIA95_02770 [Patescibacteria group bacterium]|nr:hypothetical protein [Patescibacteria group bacterium]
MEAPKENPQETFKKIIEEKGIETNYDKQKEVTEDELKKFKETEERGESVNPEWRDFIEKKNDELREIIMGQAGV